MHLMSPKPGTSWSSGNKLAGSTGFLDSLLGCLGELLGADEAWDRAELSLSEHLGVALINAIIIY